jgi:hypothetical protein
MGEHAVERLQVRMGLPALPGAVAQGDRRAVPLGEGVGALQDEPRPQRLRLDHRIAAEHPARDRQAEIDRIAVGVRGEAQLQADRRPAYRALHRLLAALHAARELLGSGPQNGGDTAFEGQRLDDPPLRNVGQQPQGAIETRLAAAVGAGDDGERFDFEPDVAQRAVTGDAKAGNDAHLGLTTAASPAPNQPAMAPRTARAPAAGRVRPTRNRDDRWKLRPLLRRSRGHR